MLMPAVTLDTAMRASEVLDRLARLGYWVTPSDRAAFSWITECAARLHLSFDHAARRLTRDPTHVGAALRRQWLANIMWYSRSLNEVLRRCTDAPPDEPLLSVLGLHEHQSQLPIIVPPDGIIGNVTGVVFVGDSPIGVNEALAMAGPPGKGPEPQLPSPSPDDGLTYRSSRGESREPAEATTSVRPATVSAWPRLDAPEYVAALTPFDVVVGLGAAQQQGVAGGQVTLNAPPDVRTIDVSIQLIADGLDAPLGWTRTLTVDVTAPTTNTVTFSLIGRKPAGPEPMHLTTLEITYVLNGTICGTASRPLVIGNPGTTSAPARQGYGTPWSAHNAKATPVRIQPDPHPADLTIQISRPNGNTAKGQFTCSMATPHALTVSNGPFPIDLGDDAKSFAQSIVGQIREFSGDALVENLLAGHGLAVAGKFPAEVFAAIREIANTITPRVPAVLLVSADPYVPWELAVVDPPLDVTRPPFLGAQVVLGRWLRDGSDAVPSPATTSTPARHPFRPSPHPPSSISVKHMAVMAGMYRAESGLRNLPGAEAEAKALAKRYDAVALAANSADMKRLLDAQLTHNFESIGGVDAIHFAGHGDIDPAVSDGSVLMLSSGKPLPSIMFRSANYGSDHQPLFFLNACMIGIGGELLGDSGGFPGNCLKGGFGGLVGALWEVEDTVAHQIALDFWQSALPSAGGATRSVGEILRDLRARYSSDTTQPPIATYLSYVYYGHPRLMLNRV
jgi:hypothetical protein